MALANPLEVKGNRTARCLAWTWFVLIFTGASIYAIFLLIGAARDSQTPVISISFNRKASIPVPPFSFCITSSKQAWGSLTLTEIGVEATTKLVSTTSDPNNPKLLKMTSADGSGPIVDASGAINGNELAAWQWARVMDNGFPNLRALQYSGVTKDGLEQKIIITDSGEPFHCITLTWPDVEVQQEAVVGVQLKLKATPLGGSGQVVSCNNDTEVRSFNNGGGCPWQGVQGYIRDVSDDVFRENYELTGDTYALVRATQLKPYKLGKQYSWNFQSTFQFRGASKKGYLELEFPVQGVQVNREQNPWLQALPLIGSVLAFIPVGFAALFMDVAEPPAERVFVVQRVQQTIQENKSRRFLERVVVGAEQGGGSQLPVGSSSGDLYQPNS